MNVICIRRTVMSSGPLGCVACRGKYEGWNFNSGNYLFTTDTK